MRNLIKLFQDLILNPYSQHTCREIQKEYLKMGMVNEAEAFAELNNSNTDIQQQRND